MGAWLVLAGALFLGDDSGTSGLLLTQIDKDAAKWMRREATASNDAERAAAIAGLCELYRDIRRDPRIETSDSLQRCKNRIWSRLTQSRRELTRRFVREGRMRPADGRALTSDEASSLAEARGDTRPAMTRGDLSSAALAAHLDLIGHALGGPLGVLSQTHSAGDGSPPTAANGGGAGAAPIAATLGGRGGRAIPDFGPDLVALIQRTIAPDFWDVVGGPGTIVYYQPLHALVVRATGEIHRELGGVLDKLR